MTLANRMTVGAVVIGRNEGEHLRACLTSLRQAVETVIYVDSGSDDGSVGLANDLGATVINLDTSIPFTAARARNAGFDALMRLAPTVQAVQFVDGDCEIQPGWIATASAFLDNESSAGVACGRRRERKPECSTYNQLIDAEWDTPIGEAKACGGDALMRCKAVTQVGGFLPTLIAGEEPELCVRLRQAGWKIWRLDAEMTLHDAAVMRFGQWWTRIRRGGHAFAEGASLHGARPERHFVKETRRALIWGGILPTVILLAALISTPWALLAVSIWPLQVLRLCLKRYNLREAVFLTLAKFPEALGAIEFYWKRLRGQKSTLIEYK